MKQPTQNSGESRMAAVHRKRLEEIKAAAESMEGTARLIGQRAGAVLAAGGTLQVSPQMSFLVSAIMRMHKDLGVVEQLQQQGVAHRPLPKIVGV